MNPPSASPTHSFNKRVSPSLLPDRDYIVDVESSHARKRPRLGHELDTPTATSEKSPSPSDPQSNSAGSIFIFKVPQDQPTDPSGISIVMAADEQRDLGNFANFPFQFAPHETPESVAAGLAEYCAKKMVPSIRSYQPLIVWLRDHLSDTETDFEIALQHGTTSSGIFELYSDRIPFWNNVLRCFQELSGRKSLADTQNFRGVEAFTFFEMLLQVLLQLGERLLHTDLAVMKQREARRDSTSSSDHTDPPKHQLLFLGWAKTYMNLALHPKPFLESMSSKYAFNAASLIRDSLTIFQGRAMDAIVTIFENVVSKPDSTASLFGLAHPFLLLCHAVICTEDPAHDRTFLSEYPHKLTRLFELVWTLAIDIMPKQRLDDESQCLVEHLQPFLVETMRYLFFKKCLSAATIYSMTLEHVMQHSISRRDLVVSADVDGTPSAVDTELRDDLYTDLGEGDILRIALGACNLEFLNALMHSSSVDLRNRALDRFGDTARRMYSDTGSLSPDQHEQTKQFITRFIQAKDLIGYLYGSRSHATLIGRTGPVLMIMTLSQRLTKLDADTLWNTSINSQQSDEAQTATHVLQGLVPYMPLAIKEYFCSKFEDLDFSRLTRDMEVLLRTLLTDPVRDSTGRTFKLTYTCISLLGKIEDSNLPVDRQNYLLAQLGNMLLSIHPSNDLQENIRLVEICVQPIVLSLDKATGHVRAMSCLVRQTGFSLDSREILSRLSFRQCVEELIKFMRRARLETNPISLNALHCRLELAFHILSISSPYDDTTVLEKEIWDNVLGVRALSQTVRDVGWRFFVGLFRTNNPQFEAFYQRCTIKYLPELPPDFASYETMPLFILQAKRQESDPTQLLPLGEELTRLALSASESEIANQAGRILMESLFKGKALKHPELAISEQITVVKKCISQATLAEPFATRACQMLLFLLGRSRDFDKALEIAKQTASGEPSHTGAEPPQDSIQIPIRVFKGNAQPQSKVVTLNKSASCSELDAAIASETGFASYSVVSRGKKIYFAEQPDQPVVDLGLHENNVLLVQKCNTLQSIQEDLNRSAGKSAVEMEMLSHLDTLYNVLDKGGPKAHTMLQILALLGFPGSIRAMIASPDTPFGEIFPPGPSLRLRASVEVIGTQLKEQIALGVADETFLRRGVHLLVNLLYCSDIDREASEIVRTAEILFALLRERPASEMAERYFEDAVKFTQHIYSMIEQLQRQFVLTGRDGVSQHAIWALYQCLLESTLVSHSVCVAFTEVENSAAIHLSLLLTKSNKIRAAIPNIITNTIHDDRASPEFKKFLIRMFIDHLMPAAMEQPDFCDNTFRVGLAVISADRSLPGDEALLRSMIDDFSQELLELNHLEHYGDCYADKRLQGLIALLQFCVNSLRSQSKPLNLGNLASRIFKSLLFPFLRLDKTLQPVVTSNTRNSIYDLLQSMCDNSQTLQDLAKGCEIVASFCTVDEDFIYPGPEKYVRQEGNYAGLANLGQTCYFNALMQQLYMNVQFRKFILDTSVIDPKKQAVLAEMKLAFASMQNSHDPFYQPDSLIEALGINSSVQDDAQIFFMGLIGKLEDSMPEDEAKAMLKKFFHGVNKSQTAGSCGHVSESTDEYVNLTLVVKGKETLDDSLKEYTSGAALEGSDKFRCTTCGSGEGISVNAVRRTGLEHIPDNLVLGLSRFRYETYDGGQKVNDKFEFPERIDMSKYKLHRIAGHEGTCEPEDFRLVGVVVHQGILNFGHYWSYAAERGRTGSGPLRWYRFEDKSVRSSSIEEVLNETRGGYVTAKTGLLSDLSQSLRSDNAFVLFYQRTSAISESAQCLGTMSPYGLQAKVSLPEAMELRISQQNEQKMLVRNVFSVSHLDFVRGLAGRLSTVQSPDTAQSGTVSYQILEMLMKYFSSVVASFALDYAQDYIDLTSTTLQKVACGEGVFARSTLQAILPQRDDHDISTSLVLHWSPKIRSATRELVLACLRYLREHHPQYYGLEKEHVQYGNIRVMEVIIRGLIDVRDMLFVSHPMLWRDFFELVRGVAELGLEETNILLEQGVLKWCFEVLFFTEDAVLQKKHARLVKYCNTYTWTFSYSSILNCIHGLLFQFVDLRGPAAPSDSNRLVDSRTLLLTTHEQSFLARRSETRCNWIVEHCIQAFGHPRREEWQEWPPVKVVVLLTDAERVPSEIYDDSVKALIINLSTTTTHDMIAESVYLCLHARKMRSATEERIFQEMSAILCYQAPAAESVQWILAEIYRSQPIMVIHHLAEIAYRLLICDTPDVEEKTRDWLKEEVLLQAELQKPYTLEDVSMLHHKVTAIKSLYEQLALDLRVALHRNLSWRAYKFSSSAYNDCALYLRRILADLETELEEWLKSDPPETDEAAELEKAVQTLCDNIGDIDHRIENHSDLHFELQEWQGDDPELYPNMTQVDEESDSEMESDNSLSEVADFDES
ncbi:hypothetical protein E4T39_01086 [Aureobasidium subglaciale]|nr:hypothetical protein E4T39_01086 [Aureobasidium subglaciale]